MDYTIRAGRFAAGAAVLGAAVGLTACGGSTSTAKAPATTPAAAPKTTTTAAPKKSAPAANDTSAAKPVAIKLSEFKIQSSVTSVPAGRVVFDVTNIGKVKHQFTVIHTKKPASAVLSKSKPNDDIPGAKGEISAIQPGHSRTLVIKDLKPGHYALVCALPGHYQAGMYANFNVS
jgi:uncharacterized cupredoxin-like copper-binding protein